MILITRLDRLRLTKLISNRYILRITLATLLPLPHLVTKFTSQLLHVLQRSIAMHSDAFDLIVIKDEGEIVLKSNDAAKDIHYIQMILDLLLPFDYLIHFIPLFLYPYELDEFVDLQPQKLQYVEPFLLLAVVELFGPPFEEVRSQRKLKGIVGIGLDHKQRRNQCSVEATDIRQNRRYLLHFPPHLDGSRRLDDRYKSINGIGWIDRHRSIDDASIQDRPRIL